MAGSNCSRLKAEEGAVRKAALLAAWGLLTLAAAAPQSARAASPYPPSTVITGISWDRASHRSGGIGGDIWPVTWAQDGTLQTALGNGRIGCGTKVSYGVAAIASATPSTALRTIGCGPPGENKGKITSLLAAGEDLYALVAPQRTGSGHQVWRSTDGGRLWQEPSWSFPSPVEAFVQFGQANADAPGGYAYLLDARDTTIHLMRVPAASAQDREAYEHFAGASSVTGWSHDASRSTPIFGDPAGAWRPRMTYNPGLKRYLLAVAHSHAASDRMGIFEAPTPAGPWRTVSYGDHFPGMRGGLHWGLDFPIKWQADGGRTLWATFSCHDGRDPGSCGRYHDRFNLMKATLTVSPDAGGPAPALAGAVPPTSSGPTRSLVDDAVLSSGARGERLDVRAALDQGRRLFGLRARYQAGDYMLAGPAGVSRQPLAGLFAPMAAWLAAPGNEHELVVLSLQIGPRSANPARFDAACRAFTTALGPYLLRARDLPAGKGWGDELTPEELADLRSRPRLVTDWPACTGERLPTRAPKAPPAPATDRDQWMAGMSDVLGPRLLKQVIIPGSHDSGTYDFWNEGAAPYAQAQDVDLTAQLNAGIRYLDIRAGYDCGEAGGGGVQLLQHAHLHQLQRETRGYARGRHVLGGPAGPREGDHPAAGLGRSRPPR
jgi:hypothetical protein